MGTGTTKIISFGQPPLSKHYLHTQNYQTAFYCLILKYKQLSKIKNNEHKGNNSSSNQSN